MLGLLLHQLLHQGVQDGPQQFTLLEDLVDSERFKAKMTMFFTLYTCLLESHFNKSTSMETYDVGNALTAGMARDQPFLA